MELSFSIISSSVVEVPRSLVCALQTCCCRVDACCGDGYAFFIRWDITLTGELLLWTKFELEIVLYRPLLIPTLSD